MRPGLLCPGKPYGRGCNFAGPCASMRPGLLCPGKRAPQKGRKPPLFRFNEAGAVMPRKVGLDLAL